MNPRTARLLTLLAVALVGVVVVLDVAYFVAGSQEMFPTAEQHEKVRIVTAAAAALLVAVEIGLCTIHRRLRGVSSSLVPGRSRG